MEYLFLIGSIFAGTISNVFLKYSDGYKKLLPSIGNICFYFLNVYLLSIAVTTMNLGLAYATWSGVGIILAAIVGKMLFSETPTKISIIGMAITIIGVAILNMY